MNYEIVDFRHLVSDWYNEFLPDKYPNKAKVVEDAGIIYLDSIPLDRTFKSSSTKFMLERMGQIHGGGSGKTCIFVREPKPANNVRLLQMLHKNLFPPRRNLNNVVLHIKPIISKKTAAE